METRSFDGGFRMSDDYVPILYGYAVRYNEISDNPLPEGGGFREMIAPRAFSESLNQDITLTWRHMPNTVFGRTSDGSLILKEDDHGIWFENISPDVEWVSKLREYVADRKLTKMSFTFSVDQKNDVRWERRNGQEVRIITRGQLHEISVVPNPVYASTNVEATIDSKKDTQGRYLKSLRAVWYRIIGFLRK
jgi:HK97 family phage prohead protease